MSKAGPSSNSKQSIFIFWCHTDLPEHFIFIYSTTEFGARRKYFNFIREKRHQHIEMQCLIAEKICSIPHEILQEFQIKNNCGIATDELLYKAGIEWQTEDKTVFRCNGKIYSESDIGVEYVKRKKFEYPVLYLFKFKDRPCYKVGISKDISRRMKEKKGPDNIELVIFIDTPLSRKLEKNILKQFQRFSLEQEFIGVDHWIEDLLKLTFNLYHVEYSKATQDHIASNFFNVLLEEIDNLVQKHRINATVSDEDIIHFNVILDHVEKRMDARDEAIINNLNRRLTGEGDGRS